MALNTNYIQIRTPYFLSLETPVNSNYMFLRYGKTLSTLKEDDNSLILDMVMPDSLIDNPYGITKEEIASGIASEINNEVCRTTKKLNQNLLLSEALNTSIVTNDDVYDNLLGFQSKGF